MISFEYCLLCKSSEIYPLRGYEKDYLTKCAKCGFVFCQYKPTTDELNKHYLQYGRDEYLSPVTIKRYNEFLDTFEPFRKTGRILDIGCGIGLFLEQAVRRGWDVYGTEFTDDALKICEDKKIKMHLGKLEPEWFEPGFFDVIVSIEVIEHINNPIEELKNIHTILRKGGLFFFTTPNFNAIERFILKEQYSIIEYPEHLCYYTPKTINFLLRQSGFAKHSLTTTGISLTRLFSHSKIKLPIASSASSDQILRKKIDVSITLSLIKGLTNKLLQLFKIGNSLKGWYLKS